MGGGLKSKNLTKLNWLTSQFGKLAATPPVPPSAQAFPPAVRGPLPVGKVFMEASALWPTSEIICLDWLGFPPPPAPLPPSSPNPTSSLIPVKTPVEKNISGLEAFLFFCTPWKGEIKSSGYEIYVIFCRGNLKTGLADWKKNNLKEIPREKNSSLSSTFSGIKERWNRYVWYVKGKKKYAFQCPASNLPSEFHMQTSWAFLLSNESGEKKWIKKKMQWKKTMRKWVLSHSFNKRSWTEVWRKWGARDGSVSPPFIIIKDFSCPRLHRSFCPIKINICMASLQSGERKKFLGLLCILHLYPPPFHSPMTCTLWTIH